MEEGICVIELCDKSIFEHFPCPTIFLKTKPEKREVRTEKWEAQAMTTFRRKLSFCQMKRVYQVFALKIKRSKDEVKQSELVDVAERENKGGSSGGNRKAQQRLPQSLVS